MKFYCLILALLLSESVSFAELTFSQTELRNTVTKPLTGILRKGRTPEGKTILGSSEVESILGSSNSEKKSDRWRNAIQRIYLLSGKRWLEVTYSDEGRIFEAILVDGKKRELIWK